MFKPMLMLSLLMVISPVYAAGDSGGDFIYVENNTEDNMAIGAGEFGAKFYAKTVKAKFKLGSNAGSVDIDVAEGTDVYVTNDTGENFAMFGSNAGSVNIKQQQ